MKTKLKLSLVLFALLFVGVLTIWMTRSPFTAPVSTVTSAEAQAASPEPGSLRWYAQLASAAGETNFQLILSPRTPRVSGVNQAISNYSVVVGQLTTQESVWYDPPDSIYTWYKFSVSETLTQKPYVPCPACTFTPTPPADLLPLQSNEILIPLPGGSAMIDNIVVETNIEDFGGLVPGERYLLFLNLNTNQQGVIPIGPQGILHINYDNTFAPVMMLAQGEYDPLSSGLATQYGNSITQLRAALNPSTSTPTPTPSPGGCDPAQAQACNARGGGWFWDPDTCTCSFDVCIPKPWLCE